MAYNSSNLHLFILGSSLVTLMAIGVSGNKDIFMPSETIKVSGVVDRIGVHGSDYISTTFLLKDNKTIFSIGNSEKAALTKPGDTVEFTVTNKDKVLEPKESVHTESFVNLTLKDERKTK